MIGIDAQGNIDPELWAEATNVIIESGLFGKVELEDSDFNAVMEEKEAKPKQKATAQLYEKDRDFWAIYGNEALNIALDDSKFPDAIRTGNYIRTKDFLKNDWRHVKEFTIIDLIYALTQKYALLDETEAKKAKQLVIDAGGTIEQANKAYNESPRACGESDGKTLFRLQRFQWSRGMYNVKDGSLAVKPIMRQKGRALFQNIFYST